MTNDPAEITNKIERELRPTYELLNAITRVTRRAQIAIRSWVLQEFGARGDANVVSQEISVLAMEHKLLPASPREQAIEFLKEIDGIKKVRATDLWDHFRSLEAMSTATIEDLIEVRGISRKLAK